MADLEDADKTASSRFSPLELRDADGDVQAVFIDAVTRAIVAGDATQALELLGDLHESDLGAVIEALKHDLRPRLVELMGREFDFAALTEVDDSVREDILEELPTETIVEGVHDLENDDALTILEDLPADERREVLDAHARYVAGKQEQRV